MIRAPYVQIKGHDGHLAHCRDFRGSSMKGEWDDDYYLVYSYDTLIAWYDGNNRNRWVYNSSRPEGQFLYIRESKTTKKHISLCEAWLAYDLEDIGETDYDGNLLNNGNLLSKSGIPNKLKADRIREEAEQEISEWNKLLNEIKQSTRRYNDGK